MIKYRVLRDFEHRERGEKYAEGDEIELEHEDAQAYVNRMMLTRELVKPEGRAKKAHEKEG